MTNTEFLLQRTVLLSPGIVFKSCIKVRFSIKAIGPVIRFHYCSFALKKTLLKVLGQVRHKHRRDGEWRLGQHGSARTVQSQSPETVFRPQKEVQRESGLVEHVAVRTQLLVEEK